MSLPFLDTGSIPEAHHETPHQRPFSIALMSLMELHTSYQRSCTQKFFKRRQLTSQAPSVVNEGPSWNPRY